MNIWAHTAWILVQIVLLQISDSIRAGNIDAKPRVILEISKSKDAMTKIKSVSRSSLLIWKKHRCILHLNFLLVLNIFKSSVQAVLSALTECYFSRDCSACFPLNRSVWQECLLSSEQSVRSCWLLQLISFRGNEHVLTHWNERTNWRTKFSVVKGSVRRDPQLRFV